MIKVLYILPRIDYFIFGNNGRVSHAGGFMKGLSDNGCEVTVISGNSMYDVFPEYEVNKKITYRPLWKKTWLGVLRAFFKTILTIQNTHKEYDVITIRYSVKLGWLFAIILKLLRVPNWGFEVNSLAIHNISNKKPNFILKSIESWIVSLAPFSNVVSKKIKQDLGNRQNTLVLPNGGPDKYLGGLVNYHNDDTTKSLYYFGKVKNYYDFGKIITLLELRPDIKLHIIGECKSDLPHLENIQYHGTYSDIESAMRKLEFSKYPFLILPFKKGLMAEIGSPTKLFEMLSMGLPILFHPLIGQLEDILHPEPAGIYYDTVEDLEKVIDTFYLSRVDLNEVKINENAYELKYSWKSRGHSYIDFVQDIFSLLHK